MIFHATFSRTLILMASLLSLGWMAAVLHSASGAPLPPVVELSVGRWSGSSGGAQGIAIGDDGALYGTHYSGGRFAEGFIFKLNSDAFSRPKGNASAYGNEPQEGDF